MRGIYNGEIKDRPHVFQLLFSLVFAGLWLSVPFLGMLHTLKKGNIPKSLIIIGVLVLAFWFILIAIGKEFIFLTINKENIIVKRPLLRFSPFKKHKALIVLPVKDVAEINIQYTNRAKATSPIWRFISHDGKEVLKFGFSPEFISSTVNLEEYFNQNGMNIRVT